jgi:uncharacterized protein (TIGR02246 family)
MSRLSGSDEAAIQSLFQQYGEAWAARDPETCASLFAPGGDLLAMDGELCSNPTQIQQYYERQLKGPYKNLTVQEMEIDPIRGVGSDAALVNLTWLLEGFVGADGQPCAPVRVRATLLLSQMHSKGPGEWGISAARFMVPFTPPGVG